MSKMTALAFLGVAHFLDHFFLLIFPTAVLFIHRDWGLSYDQALAFGTAAFAAFAVGTLPAGWLGDKWGSLRLMRVYFPALGIASIATGFADGPVMLMAGLTLVGLAAAIYHPVANNLIVTLAEKRGRALAVNGVCGNFGVAAAALVTGLLASAYGWRVAFIVPGIISLAIGIAFLWVSWGTEFEQRADARKTDRPAGRLMMPQGLPLLLFALALIGLFGGLVFNGVTVALPQLLVERMAEFDVSLADVGIIASLIFAVAGFAQLPVGYLLDKIGPRKILLVLVALEVPLLVYIGFGHPVATPFALAILVMMIFGEVPVSAWLIGHYIGPNWRARVYALHTLLGLGVGAAVVPLISVTHGLTADMGMIFALMAPMAVGVWIAAFLLPKSDSDPRFASLLAAKA
ncbi:MAG: MFS transporter [Pseudomonadota bacterium]